MIDTQNILKKAAEKCGASRVRYKDRNVPTSVEGVVVLPFFGDRRSSFVLSSLLLRRIKEEQKGSKYFVMLSWPGHEALYPYVDEYWQIEDESSLSKLMSGRDGFDNNSSFMALLNKSLNQYFYDVMAQNDISAYYRNGLTKEFMERFKHVKVSLPSIPSVASLGPDISKSITQRESKVFVSPCKEAFSWRSGSLHKFPVPVQFWKDVISKLSSSGFFPVIFSDGFSYDLSQEVGKDCLHLSGMDISKMMSAMRSCGCVLDFFGDISRISLCARTPFLCFEERSKYGSLKEYEINDLCGKGLQKEYIFGFSTILESGDRSSWSNNFLDHMVVRLNKIYQNMDREKWPSTAECNEIVPYDSVRKIKRKKFGSRFIRIERDKA
jgi:hypothetical protein